MDRSLEEAVDRHLTTLELGSLVLEVYEEDALTKAPHFEPLISRLLSTLPSLWEAYFAITLEASIPQTLGLKTSQQTWEVDLTFLSNAGIQALNREYRGKDQPTDVLSFTLLADSANRSQWLHLPTVQLGSIFISLEYAEQAMASNLENSLVLDQYILERVVHGWLHLMGVNHDSIEEYNRVVGIQKRVLEKVFHEAG